MMIQEALASGKPFQLPGWPAFAIVLGTIVAWEDGSPIRLSVDELLSKEWELQPSKPKEVTVSLQDLETAWRACATNAGVFCTDLAIALGLTE